MDDEHPVAPAAPAVVWESVTVDIAHTNMGSLRGTTVRLGGVEAVVVGSTWNPVTETFLVRFVDADGSRIEPDPGPFEAMEVSPGLTRDYPGLP